MTFWKSYLLERWYVYVLGFAMVALCNVMQVISARVIGYMVDFLSNKDLPSFFNRYDRMDKFYALIAIMVLSKVFLTVGRYGWRRTLGRETHIVGSMLKTKIWDNVRFLSMELLSRRFSKGELMNATTSDVGSARFIFGWTLVATADVIFLTTFTVASMLFINVELTFFSLGVLVFIPFFVQKISKLEIDRYQLAQEYLSDFNDLSSQAVASIRLQRVTQTGEFWSQKLNKSAEQYRRKRVHAVNTSLLYMPALGLETLLAYGVLFFAGMYFVFNGHITAGDFVAMQGLVLLIQDPLFELGYIISDFRKASVSLKRLDDIYSAPRLKHLINSGEEVVARDVPVLSLKDVSFKYPNTENNIITKFSVEIYQGDRLGIVGPIGAGKTTLIQILSGLERRVDGEVLFKGKNFEDYGHQSLRNYIAIVSQKPFLFADTVRNNIAMGDKFSDEEIWHYLELAGLDLDVLSFEDKLDTQLGEWGINLSGGQKQRLTLARALASRPNMLMLDDCLSAVDTVTEQRILENLNKHLSETTLIWVAHRKSTLKYCDNIIEMKP